MKGKRQAKGNSESKCMNFSMYPISAFTYTVEIRYGKFSLIFIPLFLFLSKVNTFQRKIFSNSVHYIMEQTFLILLRSV
jgi:hypothetical protein